MARWARIENNMAAEIIDSDPSGKFHSDLQWVECDDFVIVGHVYTQGVGFAAPVAPEITESQRRELIAAARFAIETGGVQYGEYTIPTDRESQQILDSLLEKIRRGKVAEIDWKCADGKWLRLNEDNIDDVENLVLAHVQGAFAWEKSELEKEV